MSTDEYLPPGTSANTVAIRSASRAIPNTDAPRSANTFAVVAPSPATVLNPGAARLTGGQWAYTVNLLDGFKCPDGGTAPELDMYKFDDLTMTGTHSISHNDVCGVPAGIESYPFTLAYSRPLS